MSLFPSANDFKSGPGVEKDAPRKTGVGRFFELVGRDMSGMFLANLLTCLGFLPVICLVYIGFLMNSLPVMVLSAVVGGILAGPVLAGMYDTVLRALRDEAGYWWTTYRKAFKQNFKASILPGVLSPGILCGDGGLSRCFHRGALLLHASGCRPQRVHLPAGLRRQGPPCGGL